MRSLGLAAAAAFSTLLLVAPAALAQDKEAATEESAETASEDSTETAVEENGDASAANSAEDDAGDDGADHLGTGLTEAELIRRHHEGDVAMGVCGGRLTALMWFYDASVKAGREDLKGALESVTASRAAIKQEAERRADDDGVTTSVRVMNQHSADLWEKLVQNSEDPVKFQKVHDELFAQVEECLDLFFTRPSDEAAADETANEADEPEQDGGEDAPDAEKAE